MSAFRHLEVAKDGDAFAVRFLDQKLLDSAASEVGEELYAVAAQEDCNRITLSFSGVDLLTSEMLGKVIVLNKKIRQKGGKLALCDMCPYVREIFAVTRLDTILEIRETSGAKANA